MKFNHEELRILWEAITQYVDNSTEPVDIAKEEKPNDPITLREVAQLDNATRIRNRIDTYFASFAENKTI